MLGRIAFAAALLFAFEARSGVEIQRETDAPNLGAPIHYKPSDSEWRSKSMVCPDKRDGSERVWSGPDFFQGEYGKPLVFNEDWLKLYGFASGPYKIENGELDFRSGEKGFFFGFGVEPGKSDRPAIRFGFNWGACLKDMYRLRMEIEQSVEETEWEFDIANAVGSSYSGHPESFKVKGKSPQAFESDLGMTRVACNQYGTGIKFLCKTPGAEVKIRSVKIAPSSAEVFFRKSVELPEAPAKAHCSFLNTERFKLYVNGKLAVENAGAYPTSGIRSVDLKPFLKKGANEIAFSKEYYMWIGKHCKPSLLFEGVAIGRDGTLTRIIGDDSWKCSLKRVDGWQEPSFNDASWSKPYLENDAMATETADGKKAFSGINPQWTGLLDVAPEGVEQPFFAMNETPKFKAKIPIGLKGKLAVSLSVCKSGGEELVAEGKGVALPDEGDFAVWRFEVPKQEPGPYRLVWKLLDKEGKTVETRLEEFVSIGPIKQDEVALEDFEANFEARLKLVTKIDCSKPAPPEGEFLDHAGMYNAPALNKGKIVEANDLRYRETGSGRWDYFAYRLHLRERGEPYLAEIIVPDDKDRYIYSGITENYPVGFINNVPSGHTGWYTATGTCYTGVRFPLSGKTKKLRYVFFPASYNASVVVMSGFGGSPAAACEINIYKIEGGLPALKIPPTDRLFGSHNERMSTMRLTCGMSESPIECSKNVAIAPHRDACLLWWRTLARKIALLRFQGYNMSIEGLYMYTGGEYPSKHCPLTSEGAEFDPALLMIKMFNANGVKPLIGFEYIESPMIALQGKDVISERRMIAGEKTTRLVDRKGRQLVGYSNNGSNFLDPDISGTMLDCISELYKKYEGEGGVAGFFLVNGAWWLPTFNTGAYNELSDLDVGYDDQTAALFEKETGVKLGVDPKDESRFQKRHELLCGKHLQDWLVWRALKKQEFYAKIAERISSGKSKWKLYSFPTISMNNASPFKDADSKRSERDAFAERAFKEFGLPLDFCKSQKSFTTVFPIGCWSKFGTPDENYDWVYGWNKNVSARKTVEELGAFYGGICNGLDEVDSPAGAASKWLFSGTARGVFTPRAAEDCAMNEFVDGVMVSKVPKFVVDQWLDCNLETGFGAQIRRFAKSFYATPDATFKRLPAERCKGVFAQTAKLKDGATCLRLINNTPYEAKGFVKVSADAVMDLVYDQVLECGLLDGGKRDLTLKPFDVRVLRVDNMKGQAECRFSFDEKVERQLTAEARTVLKEESLLRKVPGDLVARLYAGIADGDAFALYNTMDDYEALSNIRAARKLLAAKENQSKLLAELETKGSVRVNCGASKPYVDAKGRTWLPDQAFTGEAYGNVGGNKVDRGSIEIKDEVAPEVYRTEIYAGKLGYLVPLPPGRYNVTLRCAETFINNDKPGMRLFNVKVAGRSTAERFDILAKAGAVLTPVAIEAKDVSPSVEGLLEIEMTGNACLNGIEIEKCKER